MKNYIFIFLLSTNLASNYAFSQTPENYIATIQKVTTLMQDLSQKLTAESVNPATRSSNGLDTNYYKKMIEGLEEEVATIIGDKNSDDLSQEEKDIIQMLEMYIEQFKFYCSDLAQ